MHRIRFVVGCLFAFWLAIIYPLGTAAWAGTPPLPTVIPIGNQVQANVTEAGWQAQPQIVRDSSDGFVVFFSSDSDLKRVRVTRYAAPVGDELQIATDSFGFMSAAKLTDGRIVLVWSAVNGDGDGLGILGRLFSADGEPLAGSFPVNSITSGNQRWPDVAPLLDGGFLVVWESIDSLDIVQRRFDATGAPLGIDLPVAEGGENFDPAVAALANGGWVVGWTTGEALEFDVVARSYDSTGAGRVTQDLATFTSGIQQQVDLLGRPEGGFVAVWASIPPVPFLEPNLTPAGEPIGDGIQARSFDSNGDPVAQEATLDFGNVSPNPPQSPSLAQAQRRLFFVVADDGGSVPMGLGLDPRDGRAIGDAVLLAGIATTTTAETTAIFGRDDALLVGWESFQSAGSDVQAASIQIRPFWGGMAGHWTFDEGAGTEAHDGAGAVDNFATLVGDASWSQGQGGQALTFAGAGWADIEDSPEMGLIILGPDGGYGVTVAAWVWLDHLPSEISEPFQGIFDGAQDNYVLYLDRDNAELRFKATLADGSTQRPGIPESQLAAQRWYFVVGTYLPDGTYRIFLDGALVDTHIGNGASVRTNPGQISTFGRDGETDQYHFEGAIDQAWLFVRGLAIEEVALLRDASVARSIFSDGFESGDTSAWSSTVP